MKISDINSSVCLIDIEPSDTKTSIIQVVSYQTKPVALLIGEQNNLFKKPQDFSDFKHFKRVVDTQIVFIIPNSNSLAKLAARSGFSVFLSVEELLAEIELRPKQNRKRPTQLGETDLLNQLNSQAIEQIVQGDDLKPIEQKNKQIEFNLTQLLENEEFYDDQEEQIRPNFTHILEDVEFDDYQKQQNNNQIESNFTALVEPDDQLAEINASIQDESYTTYYTHKNHETQTIPEKQTASFNSNVHSKLPFRRIIRILFLLLCVFGTVAGGIGLFLIYHPSTPATASVVGNILFLSSEQLNGNNDQGINDEIQISLNHITDPAPSKVYYGWLLGDKQQGDVAAIPLSILHVHNGTIDQLFQGTPQHTNLLQTTSRFLITEEDAAIPPIAPAPDQSTWKYYGEFPQTIPKNTGPTPQYRYIDHLRHLLADDPTLDQLNLQGGLNNWFYQNSAKLVEWANSLQQSNDTGYITRQTLRILTYLDGNNYVAADLPANFVANTTVLTKVSQFGLINVAGMTQQTPSYIDHITKHLNGLLQSSGAPKSVQMNAAAILKALSNVQYWLGKARSMCISLIQLEHSHQPNTAVFINNLITDVTNAYVGDPNSAVTGSTQTGVVYIHSALQQLALLPISIYLPG